MEAKRLCRVNLSGNNLKNTHLMQSHVKVDQNINLSLNWSCQLINTNLENSLLKTSVATGNRNLNANLTLNQNLLLSHSSALKNTKIELKNEFLQKKYKIQLDNINLLLVKKSIPSKPVEIKQNIDIFCDILDAKVVQVPRYAFPKRKKMVILNEFSKNDLKIIRNPKTQTKIAFINAVSSSLISGPNLKKKSSPVRRVLLEHAAETAKIDPEFVLKMAVYTRRELNIRSTANLLLAFAATNDECRPFVTKYYNCVIRLPSDWIDVAEQCQLFGEKKKKPKSLPTVLRHAMKSKFVEFDEYQLAKYNKVKSVKSKNRKMKKNQERISRGKTYANVAAPKTDENDLKMAFSLKKLIGLLHLSKPAHHVMAILGKKYPKTMAEFWSSGLSGTWDQERSGKRMKLAVPETWETQLCLHKNRAKTWEKLIDDDKLPFMAMLRNLRNLVITNVSENHHKRIIKVLTNHDSVIRSKQFPFRFLSAFNVLNDMEEKTMKRNEKQMRHYKKPEKMEGWFWKTRKMSIDKIVSIIKRYKKALNKSIDISTMHNIPPIKGNCVILCDMHNDVDQTCPTGKGLQKTITIRDIGLLLTLMCKRVCENAELHFFDERKATIVEIDKNKSILDALEELKAKYDKNRGHRRFPMEILNKIYQNRTQVDNLIVFSTNGWDNRIALDFMKIYRILFNPNLLYVYVDLSSKMTKMSINSTNGKGHPNNIQLSGFSDQLLRFVAERGSSKQLSHIDRIDVKYKLKSAQNVGLGNAEFRPTPNVRIPKWRTVRVFISSTFRDMHGERDVLLRSVFPQIRARALDLYVDVNDVDLRWGITEQEADDNETLEICLTEASQCDIFLGLLGSRYGTIIEPEQIPEKEHFDWVRKYPEGSSITELEFEVGVFGRGDHNAIVCIRNNSFLRDVSSQYLPDFLPESSEHETRLEKLKSRVRSANVQLIDDYACEWSNECNGVPGVCGLDEFEQNVVDKLWETLKVTCGSNEVVSDVNLHENMAVQQSKHFVGRNKILTQCLNAVKGKTGLILVNGKPGMGKTALMSALYVELSKNHNNTVIPYFSDADVSGNGNNDEIVSYFYDKLISHIKIEPCGSSIVVAVHEMLNSVARFGKKIVLLLDGTENDVFGWIPDPVPANVKFICSVSSLDAMKSGKTRDFVEIKLASFDFKERVQFVRDVLLRNRKKLSEKPYDNQLYALVSKCGSNSPLFLTLACHQMRLFWIFENMSENLQNMPSTTSALLKEIILKMEMNYGTSFVTTAFKLLLTCQNGLSEDDFYGILNLWACSRKSDVMDLTELRRLAKCKLLSRSHFSRFYQMIKIFLNLSSNGSDSTLRISHRDIVAAISTYCNSLESDSRLDRCVAVYYLQQIDPTEDESWLGKNPNAFLNVVNSLRTSGCVEKAVDLLTDLTFLYWKSKMRLCDSIVDDFASMRLQIDGLEDRKRKLDDYRVFVSRNRAILSDSPAMIFQSALNERNSSSVSADLKFAVPPMIEWLNKPEDVDRCVGTLTLPEAITVIATHGDVAAVGMSNGVVRCIDVRSSKVLRNITAHASEISHVCFVDANHLISASETEIRSWDVETGNLLTSFDGHRRKVTCCVSSNRNTIVSVSWDRTIRVWDVKSGKKVSICRENDPINCCVVHPTRNVIAIGVWDGSVRIWDLISLKRIAILHGHKSSVTAIALSPCGKYIASSSLDGDVIIRSSRYGFQLTKFQASDVRINQILYTDNQLWTVGDDFAVKVWSSLLSDCKTAITLSGVSQVACSRSNAAHAVIVCGYCNLIKFDIENDQVLFSISIDKRILCVYFDKYICIAHYDGLELLDPITGNWVKRYYYIDSTITAICRLAKCGEFDVVFGCSDGTLCVADEDGIARVKAHDDRITQVAAHPTKRKLYASVGRDRSLRVWVLPNESFAVAENCHGDWINDCAWAVDGVDSLLVTASNDNSVKLWSLTSELVELRVLGYTTGPSIFVDVWENCVICGSSDGNIKILTLKGSEALSVEGDVTTQFVPCFDRNSRAINDWFEEVVNEEAEIEVTKGKMWPSGSLVSISNGVVKRTKLFGENKVRILSGHTSFVQTLCLGPDRTVLTGSTDQRVMMWTGQVTDDRFEENRSEICAVSWFPDNELMLCACRNGFISLWKYQQWGCGLINVWDVDVNSSCVNDVFFTRENEFMVTTDDGLIFCGIRDDCRITVGEADSFADHISCAAFCARTDLLAVAVVGGRVSLFDVESRSVKRSLPEFDSNLIVDMRFVEGILYVLESSGELTISDENHDDLVKSRKYSFHVNELISGDVMPRCIVTLTPNDILVGLSDGLLAKIDLNCSDIKTIQTHKGRIEFCQVDKTNKLVFTASNDRTIKIWNLRNDFSLGSEIAQFECSAPIRCMTYNPIGNCIICGDLHGKIYFLNLLQNNCD